MSPRERNREIILAAVRKTRRIEIRIPFLIFTFNGKDADRQLREDIAAALDAWIDRNDNEKKVQV